MPLSHRPLPTRSARACLSPCSTPTRARSVAPRESRRPPPSNARVNVVAAVSVAVVAAATSSNEHQGPTCSSSRTLLVAVDESAASKRAVIFALDHMYRPGGQSFPFSYSPKRKKRRKIRAIEKRRRRNLRRPQPPKKNLFPPPQTPPPPKPNQNTTDVVHLLHVVPRVRSTAAPSGALYYAPPLSCPDEAKEALEKAARAFITREFASLIADRALPINALAVDVVHELTGSSAGESVGDAIIRTAEELDAAALVLLSHEKRKLEQFIWGSVSKEVASRTKRPVVLVH